MVRSQVVRGSVKPRRRQTAIRDQALTRLGVATAWMDDLWPRSQPNGATVESMFGRRVSGAAIARVTAISCREFVPSSAERVRRIVPSKEAANVGTGLKRHAM